MFPAIKSIEVWVEGNLLKKRLRFIKINKLHRKMKNLLRKMKKLAKKVFEIKKYTDHHHDVG